MLQIAICDDSKQQADKVEEMLAPLKDRLEYASDVFYSGEELMKSINEEDAVYDVYILDIEMQTTNGLDIAREIRKKDLVAAIIFLTSYPRYVFQAYDVMVFNFLIKPVQPEKVLSVVYNAAAFLHHTRDTFNFTFNRIEKSIATRDIIAFEKQGRKVFIHTTKGKEQLYMRMESILKSLDQIFFVRISYSVIINLQYVRSIKSDAVELTDGHIFSISRDYKNHVKQKHFEYLRRKM